MSDMSQASAEFRALVLANMQSAKKRGALACIAAAIIALASDIVQPRSGNETWEWHWYTVVVVVVFGVLAMLLARSARSSATGSGLSELFLQPGSVVRVVTLGNGALRLLLRSGDELRIRPSPPRARLLELLREHSPNAEMTIE